MKVNKYQIIEKYLLGKMDEEEQASFKLQMESDKELNKKVENYKRIIISIAKRDEIDSFKESLNEKKIEFLRKNNLSLDSNNVKRSPMFAPISKRVGLRIAAFLIIGFLTQIVTGNIALSLVLSVVAFLGIVDIIDLIDDLV
jgi:antitoxin component of MazEF toxin-antitoxin module